MFLSRNRAVRVLRREPKHPAGGVLNELRRSRALSFASVEELPVERRTSGVAVSAYLFHKQMSPHAADLPGSVSYGIINPYACGGVTRAF